MIPLLILQCRDQANYWPNYTLWRRSGNKKAVQINYNLPQTCTMINTNLLLLKLNDAGPQQ